MFSCGCYGCHMVAEQWAVWAADSEGPELNPTYSTDPSKGYNYTSTCLDQLGDSYQNETPAHSEMLGGLAFCSNTGTHCPYGDRACVLSQTDHRGIEVTRAFLYLRRMKGGLTRDSSARTEFISWSLAGTVCLMSV